jgi:signal transduction histidine kinase
VANEAIGNALAHAAPATVRVRLDLRADAIRLEVSDDGCGFDLTEVLRVSSRLGLTSMRERAAALGGNLWVDTAPGAGTRVVLKVPG